MNARTSNQGIARAMVLAALGLSALAGLAFADERTQRSFGSDGLVQPLPPPQSQGIGTGIRDLAEAGGGRLVAAVGDFQDRGYFAAARFSPQGSLDPSFGIGGYTSRFRVRHRGLAGKGIQLRARAIAAQRNGHILVAGYQENEFEGTAPLLVRFRPNGAMDTSFGQGGRVAPVPASEGSDPAQLRGGGAVYDVAVDGDGRILAVGGLNELGGGQPAGLVLAYHPDGRLDRGFGSGGRVVLPRNRDDVFTGFTSVAPLANGKLLVAGYLQGRLSLVRLTQRGDLDPAFGGGDGIATPSAGQPRACCPAAAGLAIARRGRILLSGIAERLKEEPVLLFALRSDGSLDRAFGAGGKVVGRPRRADLSGFIEHGLARQRNGRIVVVGAAERINRERTISYRFTVLRYLANGRVDRSFGSGGVDTAEAAMGGAAV
jgi:uncharacterized delta-60 repeat protein